MKMQSDINETGSLLGPVNTVVVFGHRHQSDRLPGVERLLKYISDAGMRVFVEAGFRDYLIEEGVHAASSASPWSPGIRDVQAAVSIGGDGTFLRAARRVGESGIPLVGINTGHLGFLTQYTLDEAQLMVETLRNGGLHLENRMVLGVEVPGMHSDIWPYALNEVAIQKEESSSMISVGMYVDGRYLTDYQADGVVISTPTGSTAYNLAAGGPILQPSLRCIAVTPIAPHTLTLRPLVVGGGCRLRAVTTSRAARYRLSLDGCSFPLDCGTPVDISCAPFGVTVLLRPEADFAAALRSKLLWGR